MKNALPPHFNIHFRGWGIKYQIIFHNKNATVLILIFWTRSSHLPVPPPLPSPLQLSCRSHREIGCAGPGGCRASPGRGGRAGPPCSWSSQKGEISRRNLHMGHPVFFWAGKRIIISRIDGIIWGSSAVMDDSYMFIPPASSNFTSFEMWAFPSRSGWGMISAESWGHHPSASVTKHTGQTLPYSRGKSSSTSRYFHIFSGFHVTFQEA